MSRYNPFADPEALVDFGQKAKDIPTVQRPITGISLTPPANPPIPVPSRNPAGSILYNGLEWEHPAYREAGQTDKALLTYDVSLARLQQAGYERHARPAEAMQFLAAGLEGKLTGQHKAIFEDMLTNYGEWLNLAIERKENILVAYLDPVGLQWNNSTNKYDVQGTLRFSQQKQYDITGKASKNWIDLNLFSEEFVRDFYGSSFSALPEQMREGGNRAQVYLPPEGNIWPVGRGIVSNGFGIGYGDWASRGVRAKKSP